MTGSGPGGGVRMFNSDLSILEVQEPRKDIACAAVPIKPAVGFDLRFHAGYEVSIPLKDLAGSENLLTIIFRVTPAARPKEPSYFIQRVRVPAIEEDAKGDAYLQGVFDVGEGKYHVDWLMRDRMERFCSAYWDIEADLAPKDKQLELAIQPNMVQAAEGEQFKEEPPVERVLTKDPLNVKILVNFAPQNEGAATLQPLDTAALVSILRQIAREPKIGKFSIVAFNLQEQRVIYRQENADRIDFPALGEALQSLNLGTIDIKRLQKNSETDFLTTLIQKEIGGSDHPDALIFAGPKTAVDEKLPSDSLKEVGSVEFPVFYMNYNLDPKSNPWRDAIGRAVKFFRGDEYTISRPRDLWNAVTDVVAKIIRFKNGHRPPAGTSQ